MPSDVRANESDKCVRYCLQFPWSENASMWLGFYLSLGKLPVERSDRGGLGHLPTITAP